MLALAYDAALRREELRLLRIDDLDPAHRIPRIRAVNALGFCDPPPTITDRGTARATGGAQI